MVSKLKRTPTEWEKIFAATHQTKDWYTDYIGNLKN
jgi:hypothetical protein